MTETAPAGWYPDPGDTDGWRWWDGVAWTTHLAPRTDEQPPTAPRLPDTPPPLPPPTPASATVAPTAPERPTATQTTDRSPSGAARPSAAKPWYRRWWAYVIAGFAVLMIVGALFGDDDSSNEAASSDDPAQTATADTTTAEPAPAPEPDPVVPVKLSNSDGATVRRPTVTIRGRAPKNAKVRVNGQKTARDGRKFSRVVSLARGENEIRITGYQPGHERYDNSVFITRKLSAAEKAAIRARKKQNFINSARTIPYNQLEKNPDKYAGDKVCYRGEIFQIQEDGSNGGIMLISVTDEGYGIWDDNIWVNYERSINSAEDDIISVCGTVVGSKSYETQIGGETYVPEIDARYITE